MIHRLKYSGKPPTNSDRWFSSIRYSKAALTAMYYDTIVQDPRALRYLADIVGAERIMMGSDMPFPIGDLEPLKIVAETRFSHSERAAINGVLARKLFGL